MILSVVTFVAVVVLAVALVFVVAYMVSFRDAVDAYGVPHRDRPWWARW